MYAPRPWAFPDGSACTPPNAGGSRYPLAEGYNTIRIERPAGGSMFVLYINDVLVERTSGVPLDPGAAPNITVGDGPGHLVLLDFAFSPTGIVTMQLNGTSSEQYDRITLGGHTTLGGRLEVELGSGFMPQAGDQFQLC